LPRSDPTPLDQQLLDAHARGDKAALVGLYATAGDIAERAGRVDATCFYLTHAYIFALDCGSEAANILHARLVKYGREE